MSAQKKENINVTVRVLPVEEINKDIVERKVSSAAFATLIRQLLLNWRQGTVGSKGRSEVNLSNKKPWKQKGTGRARAGTARSPLWRGGGVIFGPQPRTRTLKVPRALKRGVLGSLLWEALDNGNLISLNWNIEGLLPKTSFAYQALKNADLHNDKILLLLPVEDTLHYASFANIPSVKVALFDEINAYDLAMADKWVVLEKDLDAFKETVAKWI